MANINQMTAQTRTCTRCGETKPENQFYFGVSACIKCRSDYHRNWYQKNRERRIQHIAEYDKRTNRKRLVT